MTGWYPPLAATTRIRSSSGLEEAVAVGNMMDLLTWWRKAPRGDLSWEEIGSSGQKAASGRSIRSSVVASAIARSVASRGSTVAAKKRAAAIFPS